jgi:hypothetical protein
MVFGSAKAEEFSKTITAEDFASAGLGKLTPEELARLDALIQAQKNGEVARVRVETAAKVEADTTAKVVAETTAKVQAETTAKVQAETTAKVQAETTARIKAETAAAKAADSGNLLHRMRVVLTPGTDIEYATVETELKGSFRGYQPGTVLTLTNGQQWRVVEGNYWSPAKKADQIRKVVIEPGVLGSFFLRIEDGGRAKVKIVGGQN